MPKSSQKHFHYHLFRQQYVELIDAGDRDTAFRFLNDNIKPLEHVSSAQVFYAQVANYFNCDLGFIWQGPSGYCEFKELCYLLTCKAVGEAEGPFFRYSSYPRKKKISIMSVMLLLWFAERGDTTQSHVNNWLTS